MTSLLTDYHTNANGARYAIERHVNRDEPDHTRVEYIVYHNGKEVLTTDSRGDAKAHADTLIP